MRIQRTIPILAAALAVACLAAGCSQSGGNPRSQSADEQVRRKWGKGLADLPTVTLVAISPHNEAIEKEFEWAFSAEHALARGQAVAIEWRNVGGGSSSIEQYLLNIYERKDTAGIDVVWGGGEFTYYRLASGNVLQPLALSADVLANVPQDFGGVQMYDKRKLWIGSAVSGFGFLYNKALLERCGLTAPQAWDDLARPELADLVALADPTQSGSAAAAYRMIVLSGRTWPEGWGKLLAILSNAKRFVDSAGAAANAPLLGESIVATSIDFYGALRVAVAPDQIVYVSPRGQTTFSPDPIAILKNAPHPELAARFVEFVMSPRGQALWALPAGAAGGPVRTALGRQPIRRDVYRQYAGKLLPWIVDPYQAGQALQVGPDMQKVDFGVLRLLVQAAALDNLQDLRQARAALIRTRFRPDLVAEFNRLPENIDDVEEMPAIVRQFKDKAQAERIVTDWQRFFRDKYRRIAEASP